MRESRIVYFSDSAYAGGAESYLRMLADGLGPQRAALLAVDHPGLRPWIHGWEEAGFEVTRLAPAGPWGCFVQLWRFSRHARPAVVHINAPGPYAGALGLAPLALRWGGAGRIVVTEHLPTVGRVGKRYWAKRLGRDAIDAAICVCRAHRHALVELFGYPEDRVVAIPNGIADPAIVTGLRGDVFDAWPAPHFLQVGSLDARKGGLDLVAAFAEARAEDVDVGSLHLVGEGPLRAELEAAITSLDLGERVVLHGHRDDVGSCWRSADVAVLASHREGLPLSLIEAMAFGLPILATAVDGVPELVRPEYDGLLVAPGDRSGLASAMRRLASEPASRDAWGAAARRVYEADHTLERMLRETYAVYGPPWSETGATD